MQRPSLYKMFVLLFLLVSTTCIWQLGYSQATYDMALGYRRPFNSDWIGYNGSNMIRDSIGWNNPKLIGNLPKLNAKILRYPAGGTSNWWNWRTGWFVVRPDLPTGFAGLTPKYSKLETFKKSLDTTHGTAMLEVNMLTSTLQEQLAMLKHADSIGVPVKLVELGSEFYLDGGEDSVLIVTTFPTSAEYATAASQWADSIHHYFPAAKVCAQGAFNRNNAARRIVWDEQMFPTLHGEDAISYHTYMSVDDYDEGAPISSSFYPSDVPVMMGRPFKMWNTLTTKDFPLIPANKEIWITEYNMRDHSKPVQGCWGQALFVATQTMQFLNDIRIKHLACHAMCGSAVAGAYFNTIHGFSFGDDGNFASIPNGPATTQYWGLTTTGRAMREMGMAVKNGAYASPLDFKYIPSLTSYDGLDTLKYPSLYGWAIVSNDSTQAILVNLSPTDMNIRTNYIFPSGGTYTRDYADPMIFVGHDADVTRTNKTTLPATLLIKAYSITRISGTTIPPAPPSVDMTAAGITAFCLGDSVLLDAGSGFVEYRWSTGDSTQTIKARRDGDYWVHARSITNGYWGGDTMHVTVYQPPAVPLFNNMPNHSFCHGDSLVATVKFPNANLTYLWSNGVSGTSCTIKVGGSYTITAINVYGCRSISVPVVFTEFALPTPVLSVSGPTEFCSGSSVVLGTTTSYNSYSWTGGFVGPTHTYLASGTYSCSVIDGNGCTAPSNSVSVNVHTLPIPVATSSSGTTTFCSNVGVYITTATTGYNYQWQQGGINISGATSQNYTPLTSGSFRVQISDPLGCTVNSAALSLTLNNPPTPVINGISSICQGNSTTLGTNLSYASYAWSNGLTGSTMTTGIAGSYTVTVIDANSCSGTSSIAKVITVNALPAPVISAGGATEFCSGGSVLLSVTTTYNSYSWSGGFVGQTHSYNASGTYSCTVTDANSCTGTSNAIGVNVHTLPVPDINTSNGATTFCSNAGVSLTTAVTGYGYNWQLGGTNVSGATNQTYVPTAGGSYRVKITDAFGCTARSNALTLVLNNPPTPNITGTTSICQGVSTTLGTSASYASYLWSSGAATSTISVNTGGTYSVTVTDANSCSGTSSKTVTVNPVPAPVLSAGGPTDFCSNGNVVLSISPSFNSYSWTGGFVGQSHTYSASGTYSCTVTDANGCTGTSNSIAVNVHSLPVPSVNTSNGTTSFCSYTGVYLTTATTGYNYQWQQGGVNISGATAQTYSPTVSGNYRVQISDAIGCTAVSASISLTITSGPNLSIPGTGNMCVGQSLNISANTTYNNYLWSTGATTQSINVSSPGTYTLTVTNSNGCSATASITTQYGSTFTPTITAGGPTEFCGGSVVLSVGGTWSNYSWSNNKTTSSTTITASGTYTCTVTDAGGCTGTSNAITVNAHEMPVVDILTSTGATVFCANSGVYLTTSPTGFNYTWLKGSIVQTGATNQNFTPPSSGTYKVQISDVFGCTAKSAGLAVTINAAPSATITGNTSVCSGNTATLSANTSYSSYLWSNLATTQSIIVSDANTYTLTVTNSNGCTGTSPPVTTTIYSLPVATISASGPTDFCNGGSVVLTASSSSSYQWSTGKITNTITVSSSGSYSVTVTDTHGCTNSSSPTSVNAWVVPVPTITTIGPSTYCNNSTTSYLTTQAGYSYQWKKGTVLQTGATNQNFTPLSTGTYKVITSDIHACSATSTGQAVTVNKAPTASISISGSTNICGIETRVLTETAKTGNTYQWQKNGVNISGATGTTYTLTSAGTYTCIVTNTSACVKTSNAIVITSNCRLEDGGSANGDAASSIRMYPNPATSGIHINATFASQQSGEAVLEVYNMLGAMVYSEKQDIEGGKFYSDIKFDQRFSDGRYIAHIRFNSDIVKQSFIVTGIGK